MRERVGEKTALWGLAWGIILDEEAPLHVICHDCAKMLYESGSDNWITRLVARSTADAHSGAFSTVHRVSVLEGTTDIYRTDKPELWVLSLLI